MKSQRALPEAGDEAGLRARLIEGALAILNTDGIEAMTLRAVARSAGVSHGAPARHFANLDALKAEVAAAGYERLSAAIGSAVLELPEDAAAREPLARAVKTYVQFALENPGLFALIIRMDSPELNSEVLNAQRESASRRFLRLVEESQARGWNPDRDARLAAASLWAFAHGLATLWMHGAYPHLNPGATLDEAIDGIIGR